MYFNYSEGVKLWRAESELEYKNQRITELETRATEMEIDCNNKQRKINELEQWIYCLSNTALVTTSSEKATKNIQLDIQKVSLIRPGSNQNLGYATY